MKFHIEVQGEMFDVVPENPVVGDAYITIQDGKLAIEQCGSLSDLKGSYVALIYLSNDKVKYLAGE